MDDNKLWKILKEMGVPDHLTCLLRNLYAGQEATVRTGLVPNRKRSTSSSAVHGVAKSRTRLSDSTFTFHFHALEKEMATYSSVLAWRLQEMGKPGGLPSMESYRVGHD